MMGELGGGTGSSNRQVLSAESDTLGAETGVGEVVWFGSCFTHSQFGLLEVCRFLFLLFGARAHGGNLFL